HASTTATTLTSPERDLLVDIRDVTEGYLPGVDILIDTKLQAYVGKPIGIIGPNGAGTSTLLKAIFGLVNVRSGTISLRGEEITNLKANKLVAKGVGLVPQTENVFPTLTIQENLEMGAYQRPSVVKENLAFVLDIFPALKDRLNQVAGSLS